MPAALAGSICQGIQKNHHDNDSQYQMDDLVRILKFQPMHAMHIYFFSCSSLS